MSLPKASSMSPSRRTMPTIWAATMKRSDGLRPVTISNNVNTMCPPSSPGMGSRFITPSMMENSPSRKVNWYQSQTEGKTWPMAMKLPTDLYAPEEGVASRRRSLR